MNTDDITAAERRELRSIVRQNFKVLRAEVERREQELTAEIEAELLTRYRDQDTSVAAAEDEVRTAAEVYRTALRDIATRLKEQRPEMAVEVDRSMVYARDAQRVQTRRVALASIPNQIGDAKLALARAEMEILRELSVGALGSEQAREFLNRIPTVGQLVPKARLAELEHGLKDQQ